MTSYQFFLMSFFFTASFMVMYFVTPIIIQVVKLKRLFEKMSDRSSHSHHVPSFGGVTFFIVIILSLSLADQVFSTSRAVYLIPSCLIIFFTGLKDDMTGISPWNKIIMQVLATTILFISPDFQITNLHGFLGIHEIAYWVCIPLAFFVVIFYINAFNLIDGIDGLASSLGAMFFTFFSMVYYSLSDYMMLSLSLSMVGAFIAFLRYNVSTDKKIFLGDTGSLLLGFLIAALVINILSKDYHQEIQMRYISNMPLLIIAALYIPIFDSIRVFFLRLRKGINPFAPDRMHIHHLLVDYFELSHRKASFALVSLNALILLLMGFVTLLFNHLFSLSFLLILSFVLAYLLYVLGRKQTSAAK